MVGGIESYESHYITTYIYSELRNNRRKKYENDVASHVGQYYVNLKLKFLIPCQSFINAHVCLYYTNQTSFDYKPLQIQITFMNYINIIT